MGALGYVETWMLLTLTTLDDSADDLGYLLHKHPAKVQGFDLAFGRAWVFYPEAGARRCTAALLLDVDPVGLVRGRFRGRGPTGDRSGAGTLDQYVNDRPYVASSLMSVAIAKVFGSAMRGVCKDRPDAVDRAIPLEATLAVVPVRAPAPGSPGSPGSGGGPGGSSSSSSGGGSGGERLLRALFEPLGYEVAVERHPLDETMNGSGGSAYFSLTLRGVVPLKELLTHLYVLIPVLDRDKHYWIGRDEIDKLLSRGEGWLDTHPARDLIVSRYLKGFRSLTNEALSRLTEEDPADPDEEQAAAEWAEAAIEGSSGVGSGGTSGGACGGTSGGGGSMRLNEQRHAAVVDALLTSGATTVLDLGCSDGKLLKRLLAEKRLDRIVGLDVSLRSLRIAAERLKLDRLPEAQRQRIELLHGSLMYRDRRLDGFDAACLVEVIEHLDPPRLAAAERSVFAYARPGTVIVTTPNVEYNVRFPTLPSGKLRHADHRFEWTREQFRQWAQRVAAEHGYTVHITPIGPTDDEVGSPTQMGVFKLRG